MQITCFVDIEIAYDTKDALQKLLFFLNDLNTKKNNKTYYNFEITSNNFDPCLYPNFIDIKASAPNIKILNRHIKSITDFIKSAKDFNHIKMNVWMLKEYKEIVLPLNEK